MVVVLILVATGAALRVRKVRRDSVRELSRSTDRRLMSPPPSPYAPSKGFRLLDENGSPLTRPEPVRPRLEPDREYVFSDSQTPLSEDSPGASMRRDDLWALSRSAHRPKVHVTTRRVGGFALMVVAVLAVGGYLIGRLNSGSGPSATSTSTSTTTTTAKQSTTTTTWPQRFVPVSQTTQSATYRVPTIKYVVSVSGSLGPTWAKFVMGPQNTLEWQGTVASNKSETLELTGASSITLGSPRNATVSVGGSPVTFPSPLPTTLTLNFVAPTTPAG